MVHLVAEYRLFNVDIIFKVPPQYNLHILKRNFFSDPTKGCPWPGGPPCIYPSVRENDPMLIVQTQQEGKCNGPLDLRAIRKWPTTNKIFLFFGYFWGQGWPQNRLSGHGRPWSLEFSWFDTILCDLLIHRSPRCSSCPSQLWVLRCCDAASLPRGPCCSRAPCRRCRPRGEIGTATARRVLWIPSKLCII